MCIKYVLRIICLWVSCQFWNTKWKSSKTNDQLLFGIHQFINISTQIILLLFYPDFFFTKKSKNWFQTSYFPPGQPWLCKDIEWTELFKWLVQFRTFQHVKVAEILNCLEIWIRPPHTLGFEIFGLYGRVTIARPKTQYTKMIERTFVANYQEHFHDSSSRPGFPK